MKKTAAELQVLVALMTSPEKAIATRTIDFDHSGTATNVMKAFTGNVFSLSQLKHQANKTSKQIHSAKETANASSATKVIEFLQSNF